MFNPSPAHYLMKTVTFTRDLNVTKNSKVSNIKKKKKKINERKLEQTHFHDAPLALFKRAEKGK